VVARGDPFHSTVEFGWYPVPRTVSVKDAPPCVALAGCNDVIVGTALSTVNVSASDTPPPGVGFETVTLAVPPADISVTCTVAVNFAALTKVVARFAPFQTTFAPFTKLDPFTVSVNEAPPAVA
jgi:hypothetical protein